MKKKKKLLLAGCVMLTALIGYIVWDTWFSPTRIAFVNFRIIQQGRIAKANDNSFIKIGEVPLDRLDRLTDYDMVLISGMGLKVVEEQRAMIQKAADRGVPVYTLMATNPANNITNLDSLQQYLIGSYLANEGKTNYRNLLSYIRKEIDGKVISAPEARKPIEKPNDYLYHADVKKPGGELECLSVAEYEEFLHKNG